MSDALNADVVVVGSGVAGSLIAWRLAEARLNVLVLEAGPRIDRVEAFKSFLAARDKNASLLPKLDGPRREECERRQQTISSLQKHG